MQSSLIILIVIFLAAPAFGATEPGNVFGIWLTEGGNSKLEIFPVAIRHVPGSSG